MLGVNNTTVSAGLTTTSIAQATKHATLAFTCVINALLPYLPVSTYPFIRDIVAFNEAYPILILVPVIIALAWVIATVTGISSIMLEGFKALMIIFFTLGPVVALAEHLSLLGATITTIVAYGCITFIINWMSMDAHTQNKHNPVLTYRR